MSRCRRQPAHRAGRREGKARWRAALGAHVRALEFIGGVPRQIVPDNLRSGVLRANWYEPGLNPTYTDLAAHHGTAILPARVRRPRDKAKVEAGVLVVERLAAVPQAWPGCAIGVSPRSRC